MSLIIFFTSPTTGLLSKVGDTVVESTGVAGAVLSCPSSGEGISGDLGNPLLSSQCNGTASCTATATTNANAQASALQTVTANAQASVFAFSSSITSNVANAAPTVGVSATSVTTESGFTNPVLAAFGYAVTGATATLDKTTRAESVAIGTGLAQSNLFTSSQGTVTGIGAVQVNILTSSIGETSSVSAVTHPRISASVQGIVTSTGAAQSFTRCVADGVAGSVGTAQATLNTSVFATAICVVQTAASLSITTPGVSCSANASAFATILSLVNGNASVVAFESTPYLFAGAVGVATGYGLLDKAGIGNAITTSTAAASPILIANSVGVTVATGACVASVVTAASSTGISTVAASPVLLGIGATAPPVIGVGQNPILALAASTTVTSEGILGREVGASTSVSSTASASACVQVIGASNPSETGISQGTIIASANAYGLAVGDAFGTITSQVIVQGTAIGEVLGVGFTSPTLRITDSITTGLSTVSGQCSLGISANSTGDSAGTAAANRYVIGTAIGAVVSDAALSRVVVFTDATVSSLVISAVQARIIGSVNGQESLYASGNGVLNLNASGAVWSLAAAEKPLPVGSCSVQGISLTTGMLNCSANGQVTVFSLGEPTGAAPLFKTIIFRGAREKVSIHPFDRTEKILPFDKTEENKVY